MKLKTTIICLATIVGLVACTQPPKLCDRAAVSWDKYGTVEVPAECEAPKPKPRPTLPDEHSAPPHVDPEPPTTPEPPNDHPAPAPEPKKPKGNNGFGNGGGDGVPGNSPHDDEGR